MGTTVLKLDNLLATERMGNIGHDEMAEAGVTAFFQIVSAWGLRSAEARILLGNPSKSRFYELRDCKQSTVRGLSGDELDRLAYITSIYAALNLLYTAESQQPWLRNKSRLPVDVMYRPWGEDSPLGYMLTGKLKAIADVYDYLNSELGGV